MALALPAPDLPAPLAATLPDIAAQIGPTVGKPTGRDAARDLQVATVAMVTCFRYAPCAPSELLVESAIRLAGWLSGTPPHLSEKSITDPSGTAVDVKFTNAGAGAGFRRSGARVLLSPYRVRRFA